MSLQTCLNLMKTTGIAATVCLLTGVIAAPVWAQSTPPTGPAAADPYAGPIRRNDVINVQIAGEASLSGQHVVTTEGTITLPLFGAFRVMGKMTGEASEAIAVAYKSKSLLLNPQVVVTIVGRPPRTVIISGALEKQGRIALTDTAHLNEILEPAGILPSSDLSHVVITRKDEKIIVDYLAYRTGNDTTDGKNNPIIEDGDKIYIRARIQVAGMIKVNGEVKNPLPIPLTTTMTVAQAIQQAGGVTELGDRETVVVSRGGQEIRVPYKAIQEGQIDKDIPLQDKDEIFVKRLEKPKLYYVNGGVASRAAFPIMGTVTLNDAIAAAGGVVPGGNKKKVTIQRKDGKGQIVLKDYNLTLAADMATPIQPDDVISVPYPKQRPDVLQTLGQVGMALPLFFLFRR